MARKKNQQLYFIQKKTLQKQYYDDKNGKSHIKQRIETKIL